MVQPLPRKIFCALFGGGRLAQHAGGGAELGLGLLGLQFQVDFIEGGERLADIDGLADLNQPLGDLAGHAKAHVGFDPGLDRADKAALRRGGFIMDRGDQNRASGGGFLRYLFVASGQREHRKSQQRTGQEPVITG